MKKFKNFVLGGIENKIFNLFLLTALLLAACFFGMSSYHTGILTELTNESNEKQTQAMTDTTNAVMQTVVESSMSRQTNVDALLINEMFHGLETRVRMMAEYAQKLLEDTDTPTAPCAAPDPAKNGQITTQLLLADNAVLTPELEKRLGAAANMSDMMISLFGASEQTNSCFIALPEGAFLVTDDRSASKFDENGVSVPYDPRTRPWYLQAEEKGALIFTDVEVDAFTGDIGIVCAMPVYVNGKMEAVVGSDLFLTSMQAGIESSFENGGFVCVVNSRGHIVFSPQSEGMFRVVRGDDAEDLRTTGSADLASLICDALENNTDVRLITLEDGTYYIAGAPMRTVGWALLSVFDQSVAEQPAQTLQDNFSAIAQETAANYRDKSGRSHRTFNVIIGAVLVLLTAGAVILGKRIVKPLNTMAKRIAEIRDENPEFYMEDAYRTGDEVQMLAESFAAISHKTVEYIGQVRTVTAEKERINSELNMAREIQSSQLPRIFPPYSNNPYFDLYASMTPAKEVGGDFYDFFLVGSDHLAMVMADVSGKGVPAALFMMISKTLIKNRLQSGEALNKVVENVNDQLLESNEAGMFVTAWIGVLCLSTGEVTVVNAGHEHPAVRRAGAHFELVKYRHSAAIATLEGISFRQHSFDLRPGDSLFVYTDGVTEATNAQNELMGEERLLEALNTEPDAGPDRVLKNVTDGIERFVAGAEQFDDITMLCLKYKGPKN